MSPKHELIWEVRQGRLDNVQRLINQYGLSYSPAWLNGYALLCDALQERHKEVARLLLAYNAQVNRYNTNRPNTPLHLAVRNRDTETVEMLLNNGANINARNKFGHTPLHISICNKKIEIIQLLLRRGAYVNERDNNGMTPLHIAVIRGHLQVADCLLKHGADTSIKCYTRHQKGYTPLHIAAENCNHNIITLLVSNGANIDSVTRLGLTALHIAVEKGDIYVIEHLLKSGANINLRCFTKGYTPLHLSVEKKRDRIVELLLIHKPNIDILDKSGKSILHLAVEKGYKQIVEHILKYFPDVNIKSNRATIATAICSNTVTHTAILKRLLNYGFKVNPEDTSNWDLMCKAIEQEYGEIVEDLLKYGIDVNMLNLLFGGTFLHVATKYKREETVKLLVKYGANVNAKDINEKHSLYYAVENSDLEITKLLLTNGADVNQPDSLSIAVSRNCKEMVELLLQSGANITACDVFGRTALHFTFLNRFTVLNKTSTFSCCKNLINANCIKADIAKLLLEQGANVNAQTKHGLTALHAAADEGCVEVVKVLLEYNADVNCSDNNCVTPLHLSAEEGNKEISKILLDKGANVNAKRKNGKTALHSAAEFGYEVIVDALLQFGAEIDPKEEEDVTPLHFAALEGSEAINEMLLNKGADVNAKQENGATPLHNAVRNGNEEVVKILLRFGANVNSKTTENETPIHFSAEEGSNSIIDMLLEFDADVDCKNECGKTALHIACEERNEYIVSELLNYGCDINIMDKRKGTALSQTMCNISKYDEVPDNSYDYPHYYDSGDMVDDWKSLGKMLEKQIFKMVAAGLYVSAENLFCIHTSSEKSIPNECEKEIEDMKNEKISNSNISFKDILTGNINQIAAFTRNQNVVQVLKSEDYKTKFPLYASMIKNYFRKGLKRKELLEQSFKISSILFSSLPELPLICVEKILGNLTDEELKLLNSIF